MDLMSGISSTVISLVAFAIFAAGVMKVFQMATTLSEIKDVLSAIKLNAPMHPSIGAPMRPSAPLPLTQSGEEMLRAALSELDHPIDPTSIELGNKS
jgi:hypothetical protein